jgi:outer membrane receptor for ferrienterochelin and colicin
LGHAESNTLVNDHNNDGFRDEPNVRQYHLFNRWDYLTETMTLRAGIRVMEEERIGGETAFRPPESMDTGSEYGILINTSRAEAFTKTGFLFPSDRSMSLGWINSMTYHKQEANFGTTSYNGTQRSYYTNLLYQWKPHLNKHTIDAGFSYRLDNYDGVLNTNELGRTEKVPGLFFQYSYADTSIVTLIAGIRADFHNLYGTIYTPRLHLRYELSDRTTLRANAGKGFRSTNVLAENQFLLASNRNIDIADDLMMEEAWNFGGSLTSYYQLAGNELRVSADFYHTGFINQVVVDLDRDVSSVSIYNLDGKSFSNVAQVEVQWEPVSRLDLLTAFRWNDVRMTTDGILQQRALTGKYKGLISASYLNYLRKWQYDATMSFNGPGRIPSTENNPPQYRRSEKFDPYVLINGQVTRKFKYWDIYIGIENLTNFRQEDPVISADNPFDDQFDASLVWGPVMGRMVYGGIRISINR